MQRDDRKAVGEDSELLMACMGFVGELLDGNALPVDGGRLAR